MPRLGDREICPITIGCGMMRRKAGQGVMRMGPASLGRGTKKSGLKAATLISASNPVSQVLW